MNDDHEVRSSARRLPGALLPSETDTTRRTFLGAVLGGIAAVAAAPAVKAAQGTGRENGSLHAAAAGGTLGVVAATSLQPGLCDVATGFGSVWAAANDNVFRIDPGSARVRTDIEVPGLDDYATIAVGPTDLWVTQGPTKVARIDPRTNQVVATIEVGPYVKGIAYGGGFVWVILEELSPDVPGTLVKIDPRTNSVAGPPIPVGRGPAWVSFALGHLWVTLTDFGGSLVKVNPTTHLVTNELRRVRTSVSAGNGRMFGTDGTDDVVEVDPDEATIADSEALRRAWEVVYAENLLWVLTVGGSRDRDLYLPDPARPATIQTMEPGTWQPHQQLELGASPSYLTVGANAAWVGDYNSGTLWKIAPQ